MLTIVIENESKEAALKLRDDLCSALVGIPGFKNNEIVVNLQDIDKKTMLPMNEEGDLVVVDEDGDEYEHCVRLMIDSPEQPKEIPEKLLFVTGLK